MTIIAMIDGASTARDFHHAAVLVQRHIRENDEPDMNGPLVNALMLKCVAMSAAGMLTEQDIRAMAGDAMRTFHTNPPVLGWHASVQGTKHEGARDDCDACSQGLTVGALR
jgi:hypothetical protein